VSTERTIGQLVADASHDLSQLVRSEVALAKAEITAEVKLLLVLAGLPSWAGFGIVALVLLVLAGVLALLGKGRLSKVGPPERTISTTKRTVEAAKGHH
jgi:Na+-transporting methylmalonyl-CoA/oxaloacetate decarboxylase gamma subunit